MCESALYLGAHCPGSDHFPTRLESLRPYRLGRTRSVVVRNLDVWWRLAVEHLQMMNDALSFLGDGALKLNTPRHISVVIGWTFKR